MSSPSPGGIGAKTLLVSAAIIVILAGAKAAQGLLAPFFLAVFLALILTPPLQWLKKKGLSDLLAILVLSTFVFLMGLGLVLVFTNSLTHFASKLPVYKEKVSAAYTTIDDFINHAADKFNALGESITPLKPDLGNSDLGNIETEPEAEPITETEDEIDTHPLTDNSGRLFVIPTEAEWLDSGRPMSTPTTSTPATKAPIAVLDKPPTRERLSLSNVIPVNTLISYVQLGVNMLLSIATVSSLVIIMVVFMLIEAARLPGKVKEAFGGRDLSNEYFKKIADDTWNYMKIKTIICFLTGLFASIGLWFLGVEYAILWGLLLFFLNYIPNIGQIIASIPPILLALIDGGLLSATLVLAWLIFVNAFFGIGVEPRFMEHGLGISSLVVLLSLIFWGWLLGPIGMFLSAPLTMVVKIVLQNGPKTRWLAVLLSNR
ncbi:MAG: AI-2E family transporter [Planctomycetaceae bacterium]|nr:AI-2E family transporter [Planctomycetaceae bacterium]